MKVLLTGATGFLGKNVARQLAARGHALRVLARETSDLRALPAGVEVARGDVIVAESVREAAQGCDAVLHMAALVKNWAPDRGRFDAVNVGGFKNALAAAQGAGARLVYTSSFMAVGPAGPEPVDEARVHAGRRYCNDYERTKALADGAAPAIASGLIPSSTTSRSGTRSPSRRAARESATSCAETTPPSGISSPRCSRSR